MRKRTKILTIGGFDPSGGAGVLADIKTFEQHKLLGMAVNTANTIQNESQFEQVNWLNEDLIIDQLNILLNKYSFNYVKIGLVPSFQFINTIVETFGGQLPKIIWDPILRTSSGWDFQQKLDDFTNHLDKIFMLTPNWDEIKVITGSDDPIQGAEILAQHCQIFLKGGHNEADKGRDYLFTGDRKYNFRPRGKRCSEKHGSGCVLSSALTANLALGYPIIKACLRAKEYTGRVLSSNESLLGYHRP